MKALTWWRLWFVPAIGFFGIIAVGFIPLFRTVSGRIINGGEFRDWCVNTMLIALPDDAKNVAANFYYSSYDNEIALYLLAASHLGMLVVWVSYFVLESVMYFHNMIALKQMKSEQQSLRR